MPASSKAAMSTALPAKEAEAGAVEHLRHPDLVTDGLLQVESRSADVESFDHGTVVLAHQVHGRHPGTR